MAGTIFSLAMSTQVNSQGKPLVDAPLSIFAANTNDPALAYQDFGLSVEHTWPLRTDSNGRLPPFWLPDGQYRVRMTDAAGAVIYFDVPSIQAVGPSTGEGGGGGGGSVDPNAIFQTGDPIWVPKTGARAGWVRMNGRTIGSASSGASERANADTQWLYEYLWNTYTDDLCPVTGGRGDTASADFAANKPIAILDMRGYGPMGLDDMGNSTAGRITGGMPTAAGSSGGSEKRSITVSKANLPATNWTVTDPGHNHAGSVSNVVSANFNGASFNSSGTRGVGTVALNISPNTTGIVVSSGGSGSAIEFNNMSPYRLGSWYQRL